MTTSIVNSELRYLFLNTGDITGANPAATYTTNPIPNGVTNSIGSVDSRNCVQTFTRVNMRRVLGEEWANQYKTFGLRMVILDWSFHRNTYANGPSRFLRVRMEGLPWINRYDIAAKTKRRDAIICNCIPFAMTTGSTTYTLGYGDTIMPSLEFQMMDDSDTYDIKFTWLTTEGIYPQFPTVSSSYCLPTTGYLFQIWPIMHRKPKIRTHGFPLPENKRPKLLITDQPENEEENEE